MNERKLNLTMLCDYYELTIGNGYFDHGMADKITYFDVFYRQNPDNGGFAIAASAITAPVATCVFKLEMNGAAVSSGMGTCGLVGPIGVWTGWTNPSTEAVLDGAAAMIPTAMDWIGLALVAIVLPAILSWVFGLICRKLGWIKDGDLKLQP